jgi:SAM-dependent methyltransferase
MEAKLQRRIQRYGWDKAVDDYEPYWKQQLEPAQARMLEMADIQPGAWVLDVACGTGLVSCRAAAQVGIDGVVVGTDIAENMVERAQQSARQQGFAQAIFTRMDAEALQLSADTFDVALCALGLMYVRIGNTNGILAPPPRKRNSREPPKTPLGFPPSPAGDGGGPSMQRRTATAARSKAWHGFAWSGPAAQDGGG